MKLTSKQIDYVNKEREVLIRLIEAKKKDNVVTAIWSDHLRLQMIQLIIDLHNLEIGKKDETKTKSSSESTPQSDVSA
jgi:hypothetical protein